MSVRIVDEPIAGFYYEQVTTLANDAGGATTDRRSINLRRGFTEVMVYASAAARLGLAPRIAALYWYDASANAWHDLLVDDRAVLNPAKTGTVQFTLAAADYLYVATTDRVGGFRVDIDDTILNNNAATLAFQYSSAGSFVTTAITDGTASGGATLGGAIGNITVTTMPADGVWSPLVLGKALGMSGAQLSSLPAVNERFYWCRMQPSALLDAVELEQITTFVPDGVAANTANAPGGLALLVATTVHTIDIKVEETGSLEYISHGTATTPTIDITWIRR